MHSDAVRAVVSFLKRLVFVEVLAVAAYLGAASLGYYAKLYRELGLTAFMSFQIAQVVFLFVVQSAIIVLLFWRFRKRLTEPRPAQLVTGDEHERLERKSTFRWDLATCKVNKSLERAALKTVAAFLNTDGGHLVLGVADDRTVVGMEHDYATLNRPGADGFENHFSNVFNAMLGAPARHLVRLEPLHVDGRECILISVIASPGPVYLNDDGKEEFFVRTGNGTTSLKVSEATAYIKKKFS